MQPSVQSRVVELSRNLLKVDFVRFCMVGALGFFVNFMMLYGLYDVAGAPILIAQVIGAEVALLSNFVFHNGWTYRNRTDKPLTQLIAQFHISSWSGMAINSLMVFLAVAVFGAHYLSGLVIGSALAMFWNFFWTKYFIWRNQPEPETVVESELVN